MLLQKGDGTSNGNIRIKIAEQLDYIGFKDSRSFVSPALAERSVYYPWHGIEITMHVITLTNFNLELNYNKIIREHTSFVNVSRSYIVDS